MIQAVGDKYKIIAHDQYLAEAPEYKRIDDFHLGKAKHLIAEGYLFRHRSEDPNKPEGRISWASRVARTKNENDISPMLQIQVAHLSQEMSFGALADDETAKAIMADADGEGRSAKVLHGIKAKLLLKHGRYGVLVDGPAAVAQDKEQAQEQQERSYQVIYSARQIKDWAIFERGPKRGKLREILVDAPSGMNEKGEVLERFYWFRVGPEEGALFTRTTLEAAEESTANGKEVFYKPIETVQGSLEYIPFVLVGDGLEDSAFSDSVEVAEALFNDRSILQNINYYQGFKQNIITGASETDIIGMSENLATLIKNPDADVKQLEAGDPVALDREIRRKEAKFKRMTLKQYNRMAAEDSGNIESAESKAQDQKALIAYFNDLLDEIQNSENKIWAMHAEYEGISAEVAITIARDFKLDDPFAISQQRSSAFMHAEKLGAIEVQKQVLLQEVAEMQIIPDDGEEEEEARTRLMDSVRNATAQRPTLFGQRPSIADLAQ